MAEETPAPPAVSEHEAERIAGPDGMVERPVAAISDEEALLRLRAGLDIVVCGPDRRANRNKALHLIQAAFGGFDEDPPHRGRMALPHFHPPDRIPEETHAFFEAPPRHARRRK